MVTLLMCWPGILKCLNRHNNRNHMKASNEAFNPFFDDR